MSRAIRISAGSISVQATLDGSRTASAIWDALPLEARVETWGEEIYFDVGLDLADESPRPVVEMGDLAYWPPGQAFCVFFGRTPASRGDECRPASPVSVFGRVHGDASVLKKVRAGTRVRVERV